MTLSQVPALALLITGVALVALGIRDSVTGSWVGAVLAGGLGVLFMLSPWALESRRRSGP